MLERKLTNDYIRGLIDGEGTFTFTTSRNYSGIKIKVPAFQLRMHIRDLDLVEGVRNHLGLKSNVYKYHHPGKDGANRGPYAMLIVREIGNLKNTVIPFFYNKLAGHKAVQFREWLENIRNDPMVPESYDILYRLHENGYYSKNPKFD